MASIEQLKAAAKKATQSKLREFDPESVDLGEEGDRRLPKLDGLNAGDDDLRPGRLRQLDDDFLSGAYAGQVVDWKQHKARQAGGDSGVAIHDEDQLQRMMASAMDQDGSDSSEDESDSESDSSEVRDGGVQAGTADPLTAIRREERQGSLRAFSSSAAAAAPPAEQARHVRRQLKVCDFSLEARIKLQPAVSAANRLPREHLLPGFGAQRPAVEQARRAAAKASFGLVSDVLQAQRSLLLMEGGDQPGVTARQLDPARALRAERRRRRRRRQEGQAAAQDTQAAPSPAEARAAAAWRSLELAWGELQPRVEADLDGWQRRTVFAMRVAQRKQEKLLQAPSLAAQAREVAADPAAVARRCHPPLSATDLVGQLPPAGAGTAEGGQRDLDAFDDAEFYQSLLRALLSSSTSTERERATASAGTGKKRLARVSRDVDRRASKGRRLRYEQHPKLVNFVASEPLPEPPIDVDALVRSVFHSH